MLGESENQFSLTRAALSKCGPQKSDFLSLRCIGNAGKPRWAEMGELKVLCMAVFMMLSSWPCDAQPKSGLKPIDEIAPAEGRRLGRELASKILRFKPVQNMSETLTFRITDKNHREIRVPVRFQIICSPTNFLNVYETIGSNSNGPGMKLTIVHTSDRPNEYWLNQPLDAPARKLGSAELWLPFAGSDFSAADLGLEFLHWPEQRVFRKGMTRNVFCHGLESTNPQPSSGGYSAVRSWVGANRPDELILVRADAYDSSGKPLKWFEPTKLQQVKGAQELLEMEIHNRQAGTRTRVEFHPMEREYQ